MKIYPNFATQFFKNALLFNKSHMLNKINQIKGIFLKEFTSFFTIHKLKTVLTGYKKTF